MIIYLARHGQTTGDIENRYGGDYDDHLTDVGIQQSEHLAGQLADKGIELLFASPRIRAQETAGVVAKELNKTVEVLEPFRERNGYGILTGMTKDEAKRKHPEQVEMLKDVHATIDGAEEYGPFLRRVTDALNTVCQEQAEKILIVTHGGPIRLIFRDILKLGEIDVDDCGFAVVEAKDTDYTLLESMGINVN